MLHRLLSYWKRHLIGVSVKSLLTAMATILGPASLETGGMPEHHIMIMAIEMENTHGTTISMREDQITREMITLVETSREIFISIMIILVILGPIRETGIAQTIKRTAQRLN